MNANKSLITELFNNSTLVQIPFFQRAYVWNIDLWERLLEDMEYVVQSRKTHFLGSIILKQNSVPLGAPYATCKILVDGQQRLTTFLIFLKVLCLKHKQTAFFDIQFRILGKELALQHGKNDIDSFNKVMSMSEANVIENTNKSRIVDAFNFFIKNIDETKLDLMTIVTNVQFVRIDLDIDENEQQIFDSLNSLGVNLTTSELLKNYFYSKETISEYEKTWVEIFERDDEVKRYWNTEFETGRVKRAMIDIFFDAYFQIFVQNKNYNINNEDRIMYSRVDNLSTSYQHFVNNYCNGNKRILIEQLRDYANCFMQTFRPEYCNMPISSKSGIERINIIIFGLKNTTLIPYFLYLVKNISDIEKLNKICGIIESYIMRRMIVQATSKNYNKLFTSLIFNNVSDGENLSNRLSNFKDNTTIPSDEEVKNAFRSSKLYNIQAKGIIYLLESAIRPVNCATTLFGFNNYSLEHLMPKKWRNKWQACKSDELARKRDLILLTLGNLAIIPQQLNTVIRDSEWEVKKQGKDNKRGLSVCAAGLYTLADALQKTVWDEEQIVNRADWLCEQANKLWHL